MKSTLALFSIALCVTAFAGCSDSITQTSASNVAEEAPQQPNIIVILADDMGFSDVGAFGSEIKTPNLDQLANEGIQLTNFHVGAACSPTRTSLMTGVDNHLAGLGNMLEIIADNQRGKPGYEGHLNNNVVTISTLLQDAGYHTYMAGKWHLGKDKANIPHGRGFERSFTLLESGADNWVNQSYGPMYRNVHYYEDDKQVDLPKGDYFSTQHYTNKIIEYIDSNKDSNKPFFAYVAYQAVHSPHQAPLEYVEKYNGYYDKGWDALRESRLKKQKALGLFDKDVVLAPNMDKGSMYSLSDWEKATEEEKRFHARRMQVYAGMVDHMDENIGRILAYLEKIGQAENTVIVFLSDNGADATELQNMEQFKPWYKAQYNNTYLADMPNGNYQKLGQKGSFSAYGADWALASNTPTSYWKTYSSEGGVRVPFIVHFPKLFPGGQKSPEFAYVTDIVPTLLDIAGVDKPNAQYKGKTIHPLKGKSLISFFKGDTDKIRNSDESVGYELAGSSAIFQGKYKLVRNPVPKGTGEWELFNIIKDPAETTNLSGDMPKLVVELTKAYEDYAKENNVIAVPEDYNPAIQLQKNAALKNSH